MAPKYANNQPVGFTNRIENVAIVGATGTIGTHFVKALLKTGKHNVTAITRVGSTAKVPDGVKAAPVDYSDESSLVAALKGQQFLIISLPSLAPPDTQSILAKAAAKAGVPYIMPNSYCPDFTDDNLSKESMGGEGIRKGIKMVEDAGVSWIAMVCSFWYEFSLSFGPTAYGFDMANKKVTFFDDGKTQINTSTWNQCGRAIAALLSLKELPDDENDTSPTLSNWANKPLYTSSFLVSQREMLDSIHRVQGTTDADWTIEYESSSERWKKGQEIVKTGDYSGFIISLYTRVFYPNGDGNLQERFGLANDVLGLPQEDLDEATARAVEMVETRNLPYKNQGNGTGDEKRQDV